MYIQCSMCVCVLDSNAAVPVAADYVIVNSVILFRCFNCFY
jgi:hypothetical protein